MAFQKGRSGNPGGEWRDKPFREALRMEIAAAGPDMKGLRRIAAKLLDNAANGDNAAIKEVADRLDGKPAQESTITNVTLRPAEMTDEEVAAAIARLRAERSGTGASAGNAGPPAGSTQLN